MTGQDMDRMPGVHESDIDRVVHDWLERVIEPLPAKIKDEVVVQAAVIPQHGRWPWQRRHARPRLDTMSLGFAPIAVVAVMLAMTALGLLFLVLQPSDEMAPPPATSPTPVESPLDATDDSTAGFTFEEVESGVLRLIDDGAGHDAAAIEGFGGRSLSFGLAAAPDGTVWLSGSGADDAIGLGVTGDLRHPIGPGTFTLEVDQDSRFWVGNQGIASWDGMEWTTYPPPRDLTWDWGGPFVAVHPEGGIVTGQPGPSTTSFWRYGATASVSARPYADPLPRPSAASAPSHLVVPPDGTAWLIQPRFAEVDGSPRYRREPSRLLRTEGGAWEEVHPLGDEIGVEPRELVLDTDGRPVVRLGQSIIDPERTYASPVADEAYGGAEWIVRLDDSGTWVVIPSHDGSEVRPERLVAAGSDSVWMVPGPYVADGPGGIVEVSSEGDRKAYLEDIRVHDVVTARDGRVWIVGGLRGLPRDDQRAAIYVITPAAATSPSDPGNDDVATQYTLEPVEPGVYRFVDDGAGHDTSDLPDSWKWLYKLTAAPDGTIWLPRLDEILHLGEPGFVANPIGPGALELDIEADGSLWIRNGAVLAPDGAVVGQPTDESGPRIVELAAHPDGGMIASLTYPDDRNELRHWTTGMVGLGELVAPPLPSEGTDWQLFDVTVGRDGAIWAIEQPVWFETQERLAWRLMRTDGQGWETIEPPDVGVAIEPLAIELATDGRLLVDLIASNPGPDLPPEQRRPLQDRGKGRWLGRLSQEGSWDVERIPVGSDPAWRWMAGATQEHVWFPLGGTGSGCAGVASLGNEGVRYYLTDKCILSLVVAPDHRVWAAASDHGGLTDITDLGLYVITPDEVITPVPTPEPALGDMAWDRQTGYLLEPVEAGVDRFVRDGAGHRADRLPASRELLSRMTAGEDGYLWLPTEHYVIHFGDQDFVDIPIGPGVAELDVESVDDDPFEVLWVRNDGLAAGDRVLLEPGAAYPRPQTMTRAPGGGMLVSVQYDDGNELQLVKRDGEFPGAAVAPRLLSEGPDWRLRDLVVHRELWAIEDRVWLQEAQRLPSRLWRFGGSGWSQVHPLGTEVDAEPRAFLTTPTNDLVLEMIGSATPTDGDHETSRPIGLYGSERWLLRSDVGETWERWLDVPEAEAAIGRLLGVSDEQAWFEATDSGPCRGLLARSQDRVERYLDGVCPYSLVVTSEGRVWVAGGNTRDEDKVVEPAIYRITPPPTAADRRDVSHGY